MRGSSPVKKPCATSRYSLITTRAAGRPPSSARRRRRAAPRAAPGRAGPSATRPAGAPAISASSRSCCCDRGAHDAGEQRHMGIRHPAFLERRPCSGPAARPADGGRTGRSPSRPVSPPCSLWNSACTAATRAAVRGRRPSRSDPPRRHQAAPSRRAAAICSSAAAAASAPLLCPSGAERATACSIVCTVSSPLPSAIAELQRHVHQARPSLSRQMIVVMVGLAAHDAAQRHEAVEPLASPRSAMRIACASSNAPATSSTSSVAPGLAQDALGAPRVMPSTTSR